MRTRLKFFKNKKLGKSCEILFGVYASKNKGFMIFDVFHNLKDN